MDSLDAAAIAQVRAGDREAFRPIVERHSEMLFKLAYRITGNESDADEIVQETFMRAYRRLSSFDGRSSVKTWLFRIATNASLDLLSRRRTQPQPAVLSQEQQDDGDRPEERIISPRPDPERIAFSAEVNATIHAALETLSPIERAAFLLRHFEECSVAEIAEALNVRAGAARHSIFRAVEKMRKALQPAMGSLS